MTTTTANTFLVADVVEILEAAGWAPRWPSRRNYLERDGSAVGIHYRADVDDAVTLELEAIGSGLVETMHMSPTAGAARIAGVIIAAVAEYDEEED